MKFNKFYKTYGGSFRTKHITSPVAAYLNFFKILVGRYTNCNRTRVYQLPLKSKAPKNFIRLDPWEGEYLYYLAHNAKEGIVETGRFHGGSTFMMGCANENVPIYSIDLAPQNDQRLKDLLEMRAVGKNIDLIIGDSQKTKYPQIKKYDVLFIDGDHSYQGCTNDLENWFPGLSKGGHVILHDCYSGSEVKESVIDFINKHRDEVEVIVSPYKNYNHCAYPEGSLVHFVKR